jgi:hypothetical protein
LPRLARRLPGIRGRDDYRASGPQNTFLGVLENLGRDLVVTHAELRPIAVGPEAAHVSRLIVLTIAIADLEIEYIARDQPEKCTVAVETDGTEHAPGGESLHGGELPKNIVQEVG